MRRKVGCILTCFLMITIAFNVSTNLSSADGDGSEPLSVAPVADAGSDQTVEIGDKVLFDGSGSYDPDREFNFMPDVKVNDDSTNKGQYSPSIAVDNEGLIHVAWQDNRNEVTTYVDIYYANSTDGGSSFNPDIRVNHDTTKSAQVSPVIATNDNRTVFVAWADTMDFVDSLHPRGIRLARSTDLGSSFGPSVKITEYPGATGFTSNSVALDTYESDTVYVTWQDIRDSKTVGDDIYIANSTDEGVTFGSNIRVSNEGVRSIESTPTIDTAPDGTVYVMWLGTTPPDTNRDIIISKSEDHANSFSPDNYFKRTHNWGGGPYIVVDSEENVHAVWYDYISSNVDVYYSISNDNGTTFGSSVMVNEPKSATHVNPKIALNSNDDLYVVWEQVQSGNRNIYFSVTSNQGSTFSKEVKVNDPISDHPIVPEIAVDSEGNPHVVWQDYRGPSTDIYYSRAEPALTYEWDFGDGSSHGEGVRQNHKYPLPGVYTVTLTVTDASGYTDSDTCLITVLSSNEPPVADAGPDQTVNLGELIHFNGSGSYDSDGEIVSYVWDFGDGSPTETGVDPTHTYLSPGNYSVTLTVIDEDNLTDSDSCIISVMDSSEPPVADAGLDQTANEGESILLDGSNSSGSNSCGYYTNLTPVALWHMNEGSGSIIYDETTNHNDGTLLGPTWVDGKFGKALYFDGHDFVYVLNSPSLNITEGMTIQAWIKPEKLDLAYIVNKGLKPGYMSQGAIYSLDIYPGNARALLLQDAKPRKWHSAIGTTEIVSNVWQHVAMTWDGTVIKVFYNDQIECVLNFTGTLKYSNANVTIGRYGGLFFKGIIDDVVIYDRALCDKQILDFYHSNSEHGMGFSGGGGTAEIISYEWDFDSDGIFDYQETQSFAPDGTFDGITDHIYGDNGNFTAILRVTDSNNLTATDTCNITVLNVDPELEIESASIDVEIGLRVAGRKFNDVGMTLYENGNNMGFLSIERRPGSPDDQMVWIPMTLDMTKSYFAKVTYTPEDPPNVGANPTWIYIKFPNGSIQKIHHTFNVQQSKKKGSDHWNHVEPWEVDINSHLIGWEFEVDYHVTDPGSDDEEITFNYASQTEVITNLNDPPNLDPYPSPEVNPRNIYDTISMVYEGPGTLSAVSEDDDGGKDTKILHIA